MAVIRMTTPTGKAADWMYDTARGRLQKVATDIFRYTGESCVEAARLTADFKDQSGNLRSSIGYAVVYDGKVIESAVVEKTKDGAEGQGECSKYLQYLIQRAKKRGLRLIVVAGMDYAEYVEAKGYIVLSSARLKADEMLPRLLRRFGFSVK